MAEEKVIPLFRTVQGRDFGRSNAWAKRTPNPLTLQIRRKIIDTPLPPLPGHIGGYQHLERGVIARRDDIMVNGGVPVEYCEGYHGGTVGLVEDTEKMRVYRKIAVPSHEKGV